VISARKLRITSDRGSADPPARQNTCASRPRKRYYRRQPERIMSSKT